MTRSITFPAYTSAELARITNKLAADREYELGVGTDALLADLYDAARVDPTFGNARYARKLVLAAIAAHSILSGTQIHPSCCSGVFMDQSAESGAAVQLVRRTSTDGA